MQKTNYFSGLEKIIIEANRLSSEAYRSGEKWSVAAVIYDDNMNIISTGKNNLINDPLDHAEIVAIKNAKGNAKGNNIFITMEPCLMCAVAIHEAGIKKIIYRDKGVWGALGTKCNIYEILSISGKVVKEIYWYPIIPEYRFKNKIFGERND